MSKPEQVLIIDPQHELRFRGPFTMAVLSFMKLTNPSDRKVLFKIKTTAPKKYCVRPNSGVLEPGANIEIGISLQPFLYDPAEKNKHKFMVQALYAPDGDVNLEQLWKDITPEQLMDTKLKCVFDMPAGQSENEDEQPPLVTATKAATLASGPATTTSGFGSENIMELQKAADEVQYLREEESTLRQENLRLKEEILKLKVQGGSGAKAPQTNRYTPPAQEPPVRILYIGIAIVMGFVGLILGKYIL